MKSKQNQIILLIVLFFLGYWVAHLDLSQASKKLPNILSNSNKYDSTQVIPVMSQSTSDYNVTVVGITNGTFERQEIGQRYVTSYNASIVDIVIKNTCNKPITIVPQQATILYYDGWNGDANSPDFGMNGYCLVTSYNGYGTLPTRINENGINDVQQFGFSTQTISPRSTFSYALPFTEIDYSKNPAFSTMFQETWDEHGTSHGKLDKISIKLFQMSPYGIRGV